MRRTYVYATVIAVAIAVWLLTGERLARPEEPVHPTLAESRTSDASAAEDRQPIRVQARLSQAQLHTRAVQVRGRTRNERSVVVRSETAGRVLERSVERGATVASGDLLCRLAADDRRARVAEASAALSEARLDHSGALRLQERGLQADTDIARAKARLATAEAGLERARIELERVNIRAPFAGVVETTHAEQGDYLQTGAPCATVIDLDPILLVGQVSERDIGALTLGGAAIGELADGNRLLGSVRFIGRESNADTRTYAIEIELPNPDYQVRSGLSAQIRLPVDSVRAHHISPALLALATDGSTGLRTLTEDGLVQWHPVTIVGDDEDGAWITGLPDVARVITVGQELVVPGDQVDAVYEGAPALPGSRAAETLPEDPDDTLQSTAPAADLANS